MRVVTVRVRHRSGARVAAPGVRWSLEQSSTSLGEQRIFAQTLVLDPGQEYTRTVQVPTGNCSIRSLVSVVLNAGNSPADTDLSNNRAQVMTEVGPCSGGPAPAPQIRAYFRPSGGKFLDELPAYRPSPLRCDRGCVKCGPPSTRS